MKAKNKTIILYNDGGTGGGNGHGGSGAGDSSLMPEWVQILFGLFSF